MELVPAEALQRFGSDRDFNKARKLPISLFVVDPVCQHIAIQAGTNFRALRSLGVTVRTTIDAAIATRCIESGFALLLR